MHSYLGERVKAVNFTKGVGYIVAWERVSLLKGMF